MDGTEIITPIPDILTVRSRYKKYTLKDPKGREGRWQYFDGCRWVNYSMTHSPNPEYWKL